jgi:tetratricopeptide (TPR) repeat protein
LLDALDEAERARLVAPVSDRADEDRLLFAHELIRQTLLSELSQPRRRRLHLRVAEAMENLYGDALEGHVSEIAHHLVQAGPAADRRKLLAYLILAGRRALATAGFEEALRHLERAHSLRGVAEPRQFADLLFDLGMARVSLGQHSEALASWQEALQAHEALGDTDRIAEVCFAVSQALWWVNRDEEGFAVAQRGLVALGDRATPEGVRMLAWAGAAAAFVTPYEVGAEMVDEAVSLARQLGDERLLGHALASQAIHRFPHSVHREVVEAGRQGATILRSSGDLWDAVQVLAFMELALMFLGRMEESAEVGEEVTELGGRLGHHFALWIDNRARGSRELASDPDLDRFEAFARGDLEVPGHEGWSYGWLGTAEFLRGDWDAALRLAEEGTRHEPANALSGYEWGPYFQILAYRGDRAEALSVLARKGGALPGSKQANGLGSWHLLLSVVEGLYILGDRAEAAALYPRIAELADLGVVFDFFCGRLVERVAGAAAAAGERWDVAEAHFRTALHQAEEMPHHLEQAETRRFYAQMLLERAAPGDGEQARALLAEAIEGYRRIGMPKHEDMALALLRGPDHREA